MVLYKGVVTRQGRDGKRIIPHLRKLPPEVERRRDEKKGEEEAEECHRVKFAITRRLMHYIPVVTSPFPTHTGGPCDAHALRAYPVRRRCISNPQESLNLPTLQWSALALR